MNVFSRLLCAMLGVALLWGLTTCQHRSRETRVLIFSKTAGFRHGSIGKGKEALVALCKKRNILVDTTEDSRYFNERNLQRYSAVIFLSTTGNILNRSQEAALQRYMEAGGGWVGIHSATDTEYEWPWYRNNLSGTYFKSHPAPANAKITKTKNSHPSTDHLEATWQRFDEWYNFTDSLAPGFVPLLMLDETSYEGGKMGANHPIAWYHELDHGRAFYTGLGHTEESYAEEPFLKHVEAGLLWAIGDNSRDYGRATTQIPPDESRFSKTILDFGLNEPGELAVTSTGGVFYMQRKGELKYYHPDLRKPRLIATLPVWTKHEDGVLGITTDPNFAKNNWLYIYYSPLEGESRQVLSRFTFKNDTIGEEKVLLTIPTQRQECCHSGGSLTFDAKGNLWLSVGDNTNPFASTGYAPIDEREGRSPWDAQKSSANTQDLRGKILRITPSADGGYTVPAGNLFTDKKAGRPEIFVMGCRNPYRISVDSKRGIVYWGDVGPDAGKDSTLGPRGHDEFNMAMTPGYYGWPYFIADNQPYAKFNFTDSSVGPKFEQKGARNTSPNSTGAQVLPPARPALLYYPYDVSPKFPQLGKGGRCAMAGPVYHYDPNLASNVKLPAYYDGAVIAYDWMRDWFFAVWTTDQAQIDRMEPMFTGVDLHRVIDMELAPDGSLYALEYGDVWFSENDNARLVKVEYNHDNRAPVAKASADVTSGQLPLEVKFSSAGSFDPDYGDTLRYEWRIDGGKVNSTEANPTYTFTQPGNYLVNLVVTDASGRRGASQIQVKAGNALPSLTLNANNSTSFYWPGVPFAYSFKVEDKEDGSTEAGGIARSAIQVTQAWLPQGSDLTLAAQGHQLNTTSDHPGAALMAASDCKACHQKAKQSVGPAYQAIAARYSEKPKEFERLAKKIISGGAGNWGDHGMSAHPQLTLAQTRTMVDYIMTLKPDDLGGQSIAPAGSLSLTNKGNQEGSWALTATYVDRGGKGIGPNKVSKTWVLRNARVEGESADKTQDAAPKKLKDPATIKIMQLWKPGAWARFNQIDLTKISAIQLQYYSENRLGELHFHIDAPDGPEIGVLQADSTGAQTTLLISKPVALKPITGVHDLYIVAQTKNTLPKKRVPGFDWIYFVPSSGKSLPASTQPILAVPPKPVAVVATKPDSKVKKAGA